MRRLIDISPTVSERSAVWPGDVPFRRRQSLSIEGGDNIDLSALSTTVHVGAHADAPSHYEAGGQAIAGRPLDLYYGPCQVVEAAVKGGARISPADLADEITEPRVLLKTGTWPDPEVFNRDFAALSPELVESLHAKGVVLVGIDTPSVDLFEDQDLQAHTALAQNDMANLECLALDDVPPGVYTLIALPLKIEGADASPVRAALIADPLVLGESPSEDR